jgi:hypothetical protein
MILAVVYPNCPRTEFPSMVCPSVCSYYAIQTDRKDS